MEFIKRLSNGTWKQQRQQFNHIFVVLKSQWKLYLINSELSHFLEFNVNSPALIQVLVVYCIKFLPEK